MRMQRTCASRAAAPFSETDFTDSVKTTRPISGRALSISLPARMCTSKTSTWCRVRSGRSCLTRAAAITIRNVNITNHVAPNRDGIDPVNSSNITVENCLVIAGDDAFCPKSGNDDPEPERGSVRAVSSSPIATASNSVRIHRDRSAITISKIFI